MGNNAPVSFEDINLMENIFQNDVAALKGNSVQPHPPVVDKRNIIDLSPGLKLKGKKVG